MKRPKGYHSHQWDALKAAGHDTENRPVKCWDCGWTGRESELKVDIEGIEHLEQRLTSGDPSPVGECPALEDESPGAQACGSFVYYDDIEIIYKAKPTVLEALAECAPARVVRKKRIKRGGRA